MTDKTDCESVNQLDESERFKEILEECYQEAEELSKDEEGLKEIKEVLGEDLFKTAVELAKAKHASRGAALTLATYKIVNPEQDIRRHKSEFEGGFSARGFDTKYTVRFLENKGLPYNVESHWLTQTLSFAGPLEPSLILKTVPKSAGPNLISIVNAAETCGDEEIIKKIITLIIEKMIEERNKGDIPLTRPKNLSIDQVMSIIESHFKHKYEKNAPRLPQLAIYAIYECLMSGERYEDFELKPIERLKTANRKSGSVGDIDLHKEGRPIEAVEVKYEIPICTQHVAEAIQKIKAESVERYFILSTSGINSGDEQEIQKMKEDFLKSNGCEIIVNGVYNTLRYYLRLLRSTNNFVNCYADLLGQDSDVNYEHKIAWNEICATR